MIDKKYLKSFKEEVGLEYKYSVKSGLLYKDAVSLRLQINRIDSGLNVRGAVLITTGYKSEAAGSRKRIQFLNVINVYDH